MNRTLKVVCVLQVNNHIISYFIKKSKNCCNDSESNEQKCCGPFQCSAILFSSKIYFLNFLI